MKSCEPNSLPETLYTARACREIDQRVIAGGTVTGIELMNRAGEFSYQCLRTIWPDSRNITILCGRGNNGGDGYVLAALARCDGYNARVYTLGEPTTPDAVTARRQAEQQGCEITDCQDKPDISSHISETEVLVDALLGTGVDREVDGYLARMIEWINLSGKPVLSCDVPTGLNSDTGAIMGICVKAEITTTFIALKAGLFTAQGRACCGRIYYTSLEVPTRELEQTAAIARRLTRNNLAEIVKPRSESAHKGTCGFSAIIGGSPGMMGAVIMAGKAAYRSGCGRVRVLTHSTHSAQLPLFCPELMTGNERTDVIVAEDLAKINALAIGPGLGQGPWARSMFCQAMQYRIPMVIDADGLNLLASDADKRDDRVLTPHPGEAARLLDCGVADIEHDRYAAANEIVRRYGGICVLKGSGTLVACKDQITCVCDRGNAGQATAGMGDVLTGIITGLLAQGFSLFDSACMGVWLHARAADDVALANGKIGMMASDILPAVQKLHNRLIEDFEPKG